MGFWVVSLAALADGVNPCAFATLVLFVSMLDLAGRSRREVLVVGVSFGVAVYLSYLGIGLFLFELFAWLQTVRLVSEIIAWAALAVAVVLAVLCLLDGIRVLRAGRADVMLLRLPKRLKGLLRRTLRRSVHAAHLGLGAFLAGVLVSLLESLCTGQVYFPVIAGLVRNTETRTAGLLYLLWYNLLFAAPLGAVFLLAFAGVGSETFASLARRHAALVKFALAGVFLAMAAWLGQGL
jgi:cytochrome c biogenesis protein CcdA